MPVAIINYELGNLRSVQNALEFLGDDPFIAQVPADLDKATHIILPGVGAFGDGIAILNERGWTNKIYEQAVEKKKPFLGICLGMQLLAETGLEYGAHKGLGLIKGTVRRLNVPDRSIRVPHIGWNAVNDTAGSAMYAGLEDGQDYYFVHSFVLEPDDKTIISGSCNHGEKFVASLEQDNIWAHNTIPKKARNPASPS